MQKCLSNLTAFFLLLSLLACQGSVTVPETKDAYFKELLVLSSVDFNGISLNKTFTADETIYTATVENSVNSILVTPSTNTPYAITIDGTPIESGANRKVFLSEGKNQIKISISEDEIKKVYQFTITRTLKNSRPSAGETPNNSGETPFESEFDITALTFSAGTLIPDFSNTTLTYTLILDSSVENLKLKPNYNSLLTVTVNNTTTPPFKESTDFPIAIGNNTLDILVTAENDSTKRYVITAVRFAPETPVITPIYDVNLASLQISQGILSPVFSSTTYEYTAVVETDIASVKITPATVEAGSIITINDIVATSELTSDDIALSPGENNINIVTKAVDGKTKTYTLILTRKKILSADNNLSAITVSAGNLSPVFSPETTSYNTVVDYATNTINIGVTLASNDASLTLNNLTEIPSNFALETGDNQFEIKVTAENGSPKTYTVVINRELPNNDNTLSTLIISDSNGNQSLDINVLNQTTIHTSGIASVTITPTLSNSLATIELNGSPLISGNTSDPISISDADNNPITLVITAENNAIRTFTLTAINVSNTNLTNIELSTGFLDQTFQSNQTSYTANLGYIADSIKLKATLEDPSASLTIENLSTADGVESLLIPLTEGSNALDIIITANETTNKIYSIDLTRRNADSLAQQVYLKASNPMGDASSSPRFGFATALDGDTLVIGSDREGSATTGVNGDPVYDCVNAINCALNSGAVYVFIRTRGIWTQQAYIKPSDTQAGAEFGHAIALDGDTLIVGSHLSENAGSAYLYRRNGSTWTEEAILKASNADNGDRFGMAVDISGNTVVIGAKDEDSQTTNESNNEGNDTGAAYVFFYDGNTWGQQAYLKASTLDNNDYFGISVTISGNIIAVGATGESSPSTGINGDQSLNNAPASGASYIFNRTGTNWTQTAYLKASNTKTSDLFGASIDLDNNTLAIGSRNQSGSGVGVGAVQTTIGALSSGAVYIFLYDGNNTWVQQEYIKPSNTGGGDIFHKVALSNNTLIVGARYEDGSATVVNGSNDNLATTAGAAYVFKRTGNTWVQTHYLKASNAEEGDQFGQSVSVDGDTLIVSAHFESGGDSGTTGNEQDNSKPLAGAVYIFQ